MIIYASILIKRENIMAGGRVIRVGDMTTHGGTVIEGDPTMIINGRAAARVGDLVACPVCLGVYPIIEGNPGLTSNGKPIAYEGCRTACGAQLILKENATFIHRVPSGGSASVQHETSAALAEQQVIGQRMQGRDEPNSRPYSGRFKVVDRSSGRPYLMKPVEVTCSDGQVIKCTTDEQGYTPVISSDRPSTISIKIME
ncbi:PAAR domain-containing protein [Zymobacter sp. IVIA_12111.31 C1]|uniref:PAAR domain-containing protein n=1 Tax=Zymobacter sp. IVIA_12111.31 C1 TaxID=3394854 RepID=UPI0039C18670